MSSWNILPEEILLLIFSKKEEKKQNVLSQSDVLRCISVCKGWKKAAQLAVYQHLVLCSGNEVKNIITAFASKELDMSKLVKRIQLRISPSYPEIYEDYMEPLAIMFPYIKEISTSTEMHAFYEHLIPICLDGKWRFLTTIPKAEKRTNRISYVSCALACKHSLTCLDINDDRARGDIYSYSHKQYNRLVSQLEHFQSLQTLSICKTSTERFPDFDSVIDKCSKLTSFTITVNDNRSVNGNSLDSDDSSDDSDGTESIASDDSDVDNNGIIVHNNNDPEANTTTHLGANNNDEPAMRHIPPTMNVEILKMHSNITAIKGNFIIDNDTTMKYIMHKFPKLQTLFIKYINSNKDRVIIPVLNITLETLLKFTDYLEKLKEHLVEIYVDKYLLFQLLESDDKKLEYLNITYWNISMRKLTPSSLGGHENKNLIAFRTANPINNNKCIQGTSINYGFYMINEMPHLHILEKYGHLVKYLEFGFGRHKNIRIRDNQFIKNLVEGYFLDHILVNCTHLEHLYLRNCPLSRCDPSMLTKNHSITTLTLRGIKLVNQFFYELSVRLMALKHIDLEISAHLDKTQVFMIDVPYTDLEAFTFSYIRPSKTVIVCFQISTENQVYFYQYHSSLVRNTPKIFKSSLETYQDTLIKAASYHYSAGNICYLSVSVRCKNIKKLILDLSGTETPFPYLSTIVFS